MTLITTVNPFWVLDSRVTTDGNRAIYRSTVQIIFGNIMEMEKRVWQAEVVYRLNDRYAGHDA